MKKILCLLLVVVMLAAVLVSCKDNDDTPDDTTTAALQGSDETEDPNRVAPETKDFGGYEYKFVMDNQTDYEVQVPEEIGSDGINKALVERNKKVESLYNVTISENRNPNGENTDGYSFLDSASSSGDYFGDIYSNYAIKMVQSHSIAGFYLDLSTLDSLRLDKEWWDQDYINEMTVNGHIYTMTGDIQTNDDLHETLASMNLTLYNETYPEKSFYDIVVKNGAWTFDEFYETWYNFGSKDGGTTGKVDSDDIVGYYYDCRTASYMYMASGLKAFTVENNKPVLTISTDKALRVMDNLKKITDAKTNLKTVQLDNKDEQPDTYAGGNQHFAAGKALFISCNFTDALQYQLDMEDTVVYPPFPKYDLEQDRYYSLVHMCFEPIAISANVADPERTALLTEALCFYSNTLEEEVMKVLLKERLTAELETREILQLTLNSKVYDFEYTANIMDWTSQANDLFCKQQTAGYKSSMDALSKKAVTGRGSGTLEKFLSSYGKLNFRK